MFYKIRGGKKNGRKTVETLTGGKIGETGRALQLERGIWEKRREHRQEINVLADKGTWAGVDT